MVPVKMLLQSSRFEDRLSQSQRSNYYLSEKDGGKEVFRRMVMSTIFVLGVFF
jgi:hypothetical protein